MNSRKSRLAAVLQAGVVLAVVAGASATFWKPECVTETVEEVLMSTLGGVLMSGVKLVSTLSRGSIRCRPLNSWWCYGWAVAKAEFACGLLAGFLAGIVIALWNCYLSGR